MNGVKYKNENTSIKDYICPTTPPGVSKKMKEKIVIALREFLVIDNRPLYLVDNKSFVNLTPSIFDIGKNTSKLANVNIADILPHITVVTRNILK